MIDSLHLQVKYVNQKVKDMHIFCVSFIDRREGDLLSTHHVHAYTNLESTNPEFQKQTFIFFFRRDARLLSLFLSNSPE